MRTYIAMLWLASSLPVGLAFIILPPAGRFVLFTAAVVLDMAHSVSPIVASWAHPEFRQVMLRRPWKYLGWPIALAIPTVAIGWVTSMGWTTMVFLPKHHLIITDWRNPFPILIWSYIIWNAYHFGAQNFGVLSLLRGRRSPWQRTCDKTWCMGLTALLTHLCPNMMSFNHWITEIGLTARVSRRWLVLFLPLIAVLGLLGFVYTIPNAHGQLMIVLPWLLSLRIALGLWHFLQDRWMWKLSDPLVRSTIGKELFLRKK